jgi:hypothetical protein
LGRGNETTIDGYPASICSVSRRTDDGFVDADETDYRLLMADRQRLSNRDLLLAVEVSA